MRLADFPDVQGLPVRQKLELVDELWISMGPELDSLEVSEPEQEVLDERGAAFVQYPEPAITLDEFRKRMKAERSLN